MGKMNLLDIAIAYLKTLRNYQTNRTMWVDVLLQVILPVSAGVAFVTFWPLTTDELNEINGDIISCVSIISALLCGVAVMVFQLRMQMASQTNPAPTKKEKILVDELFQDILWTVVVGFASIVVLVLAEAFGKVLPIQRVLYSISVSMLVNFIFVTCMCIKRLNSTYRLASRGWDAG